jgi:glycerol-3-phosphate dehydrogenase (NAD(P)+)
MAKGLAPPEGDPPTAILRSLFGPGRTGCVGGPAHAREMVSAGAGLVAASDSESLATAVAGVFIRAGVVCEESNDPVGVELAGVAKNAAALASGATVAQGLNVAGAAAGHIFGEVWRWAESRGARPESMIGLAGTGDLVATALAPESRNRRAGELLADGVPAEEIGARVGQAVEALETVPLLARALARAAFDAPITVALARLIAGDLPLEEWIAVVRTTVPPSATKRAQRNGAWARFRQWIRRLFRRN